jgi:hypothetical protein
MGFTTVLTPETDSTIAKWHDALGAYLGAVSCIQTKNPDLRAKLLAPYELTAKAVREAKKRLRENNATAPPQVPPATQPLSRCPPDAAYLQPRLGRIQSIFNFFLFAFYFRSK